MDISITLELKDKLTLPQFVAMHERARSKGFMDTDDYVTSLVLEDLDTPITTAPKPKSKRARYTNANA